MAGHPRHQPSKPNPSRPDDFYATRQDCYPRVSSSISNLSGAKPWNPVPNEYYDRTPYGRKPKAANRNSQDAYWLLRSNLTQAIAKNWDNIIHDCPEVHACHQALVHFLKANPTHTFRVFRPEDSEVEQDAATPTAFLR